MTKNSTAAQEFVLQQDEELRIEVEAQDAASLAKKQKFTSLKTDAVRSLDAANRDVVEGAVQVELLEGMAEIFGTELVLNTTYVFKPGSKFAIFTYHGCKVSVKHCMSCHGISKSAVDNRDEEQILDSQDSRLLFRPYTSRETPMLMYLNLHASLEQMRNEAEAIVASASVNKSDRSASGGGEAEASDDQEIKLNGGKDADNGDDEAINIQKKPYAVDGVQEAPLEVTVNDNVERDDSSLTSTTKKVKMMKAGDKEGRGPTVMVVGPCDVGKSTLCRILLNYAARMGRKPFYVDLDVGQGSISVPGTIGATLVDRPISVTDSDYDRRTESPLVFHYGYTTPGFNPVLYERVTSRMANVLKQRLALSDSIRCSGVIINTCGWIRGQGYKLILHTAVEFQVDVIVVLDQERLYRDLENDIVLRSSDAKEGKRHHKSRKSDRRDVRERPRVIWLPKSGGVVERPSEIRCENRLDRIRRYFYGPANEYIPHSFNISFEEVQSRLFKIGTPTPPDVALPLGFKHDVVAEATRPTAVSPSSKKGLLNRLVALSFAGSPDELADSNVEGFIVVTDVDIPQGRLTVLSPRPGPLPTNSLLVISEIEFVEFN